MNENSVIIYGAGYQGGRCFEILSHENVHVEAFCDRSAKTINRYYGCQVLSFPEALEMYSELPFVICIDDKEANNQVYEMVKKHGLEAYHNLKEFYQGNEDINIQTLKCGKACSFQIVPNFAKKGGIAYCFGIGFDYTFEQEIAKKYGMAVWAFDPSPEVVKEMAARKDEGITFIPYGLSDKDGKKAFHSPSLGFDYSELNAPWAKGEMIELETRRLTSIMNELGHNHIDLLKLDIEGSEYSALPDIIESGIFPKQICIETHARVFEDSVSKIRWVKSFLNSNGYSMVYGGVQEQTYVIA